MIEKHQRTQDTMTSTPRIPEVAQLSTDARRDAEPVESPALADAEEEEFTQLWAADPGNQGA